MSSDRTFVSLFAGIEGTGLGLERAGWRCIAQVEVNAFCNRVRARHYPGVAQFGDVRGFGDAALTSAIGERDARSVELVCGGFPCQDLSVAGRRAGLAGARSGLFWEFVRVARELRPTWILVENVPGLRSSSKGRDFGTLLHTLDELGYFVEGTTLDSRYFGVPQRRRRMFFVGHLGGPPARPVLFESEGGVWDLAAGDEEGPAVAHSLRARPNASLREDSDTYVPIVGATLKANTGRNHIEQDYIPTVGRALTRTMGKHHDDDTDTLVAHSLTATGFDASEDGTGRGTPLVAVPLTNVAGGRAGRRKEDDVNLAVFRKSRNAQTNEDDETWVPDDAANTLNTFDGGDARAKELMVTQASVRRLTPTECERLQGFPDGWTCLCGKTPCTCPDGPRYAALGNAVTVNVAEWIGRRIVLAEQ